MMMNISGASLGTGIRADGGGAARASNPYDAKIQKLQAKRAEYVEKLSNVREEATSAEHAKQLAEMYQNAISGIDMQIAQLQKAKAESARNKAEEQASKTGKTESPKAPDAFTQARDARQTGEARAGESSDPFGEQRSGMRSEETPEERKRRNRTHLGTLVDTFA